jgi:hypothetical protein
MKKGSVLLLLLVLTVVGEPQKMGMDGTPVIDLVLGYPSVRMVGAQNSNSLMVFALVTGWAWRFVVA